VLLEERRGVADSTLAFVSIFENAVEGIFQSLPDGRYLRVNNALAHIYGYADSKELMDAMTDIGSQLYVSSSRRKEFMELITTNDEVSSFESEVRRKGGATAWISENARAVRDDSGLLLYYEGFVVDITDRRRRERQIEHMEAELLYATTMNSVGALASGIAHDVRSILSLIDVHAQIADSKLHKDDEVQPYVSGISDAVVRGITLINKIGDFGKQSPKPPEPVRLDRMVPEIIRMLHASLPAEIEIKQRIDTTSGSVLADPTDIYRIVINLCTNAFRAMGEKGGILDVALRIVEIEKSDDCDVGLSGAHLSLVVSDDGQGMDEDLLNQIFEPFFSTKEGQGMSGIGLSVVAGLVESLGGKIKVESRKGEGTRFEILLPSHVSAN
jgi:PAS domain S-box-containing protein